MTKGECEDRCLSESVCLSASYDHVRQECHLSREDRFTKPNDFVVRQGVDYLENQCQSGKTGFSCSTQGFRTVRITVYGKETNCLRRRNQNAYFLLKIFIQRPAIQLQGYPLGHNRLSIMHSYQESIRHRSRNIFDINIALALRQQLSSCDN